MAKTKRRQSEEPKELEEKLESELDLDFVLIPLIIFLGTALFTI